MLLIYNGLVLTCNGKDQVLPGGAVLLDGDEILAVGSSEELTGRYPGAEKIDARGRVVMPGLINAHMHLYSTFARGMDLKTQEPPADFLEILEKLWWRLDNSLVESQDIYYSALYAIIEGIQNGTTTIFDHHASFGLIDGSLDIIKEAAVRAGIRASLCFETSDRHGEEASRASLEENVNFIENIKPEEKSYLQGMFGLHASFTLEDSTLKEIGRLADELKVPCHLHVAEGRADVRDSQRRGYENIGERLDRFDIWQPDTLAVHGVHLSREEYQMLAERDCLLVNNPESNMSNAVGAADLPGAAETGLALALGTDGYTTDMFESLKVAALLPAHQAEDPRLGGELARQMLFETNGQLAGRAFGKKLGSLEAGAGADVIIVDYQAPTPLTSDNYFYHILMGMSGARVDTTIARGEVLMEDREVKILDHEKFTEECQQQSKSFWQRF